MQTAVLDALNDQIQRELYAAYLYLGMSAHLEAEGFEGFGRWMRSQAAEEVGHATRLVGYVLRRGGRVELRDVPAPSGSFGDPLEVYRAALEHERKVTASIHDLYSVAQEHGDLATQRELDWFVVEQVEEEETAQRAVDLLTKAEGNDAAYLMLDREFGQRSPGEDGG